MRCYPIPGTKEHSVLALSKRSIIFAALVYAMTLVTGTAMLSIAHAGTIGKKSVEHVTRLTHMALDKTACVRLPGPVNPLYKLTTPKTLTSIQLRDLLASVGFKGKSLKIAWAVAMRESHGHPYSYNGNTRTGDKSYGLFQINMIGSLGVARKAGLRISTYNDLFDPATNALAAYKISHGGKDWGSWGLGPNAYYGAASPATVAMWYPLFPTKVSSAI